MPELLVVPPDLQKETANLTEVCPVTAFVLAGVWWNVEATHYYKAEQGVVCHAVVPQYNLHGNYFIGSSKTTPYRTTPSSCDNDSYPFEQYLYHGSVGYYSFYEGEVGTYCTTSKTAYIVVEVLGSYDINGEFLAKDTGSTSTRIFSYWYGVAGVAWLIYRALTIHRSFVACRRYGLKCNDMGVGLGNKEAMVFVRESLRLSAHGATNYQRMALLYLIVEEIMSDLFLIIANDGWTTKIQYLSLGYSLSGLMLLLFEMVESMKWLGEKWRQRVKRVFLSYETAFVGELVSALALQAFLTGLNGSEFRRSRPVALAVSYYFWSLISHGVVVIVIIGIIASVRVPWAMIYVWIKHRTLRVLSESCCIDSALGPRSRLMMLGGYRWEHGRLYYKVTALKAFGMLKMEEDGVEYLVLQRLHWFTVPRDNLVVIGVISGHRVEPCAERACTGIITLLNRKLGGALNQAEIHHNVRPNRTILWSGPNNAVLPSRS
ncbi:hypothetical protein PHYSODRAFT_524057 [Phytophthora sojae]|uniref:Uncharacterized protein n=1 Tax=Phytophthora sojae (strain P6497) TaxID=1094619 RepID=G5A5F9_PHYSP|nr:hypothetical protein PHYSODRAFT_524057 [Phytophthora sojae]EGZ09343.1 hypothetical protein PHYSODRAFT_524057 [Phytophthora sojae]|eukprot:XP_009535976.1 hypothetical protein PHYSODRAFT_524057 [Phytophthora sojae]